MSGVEWELRVDRRRVVSRRVRARSALVAVLLAGGLLVPALPAAAVTVDIAHLTTQPDGGVGGGSGCGLDMYGTGQYNYSVGGDSCNDNYGVRATAYFYGDRPWHWDPSQKKAHVLAAAWERSAECTRMTFANGKCINFGAEVGWYEGCTWSGPTPVQISGGQQTSGPDQCSIQTSGWYEQDVNNGGWYSTMQPSAGSCNPYCTGKDNLNRSYNFTGAEPVNSSHVFTIQINQPWSCAPNSQGEQWAAYVDGRLIQTPGCEPVSMQAVMAGMEELAPTTYSQGGEPDPVNQTSMVSFSNLQYQGVDNTGYCYPNQWCNWDHCSTAYVDAIWDSNSTHFADFTDNAGPYPIGFTSDLENQVTAGGNRPTSYSGHFGDCNNSAW